MRFSVALCTYNGAKHLNEQLASIAAQTRPPDELVVCDDRSSDATGQMLQAFAASAPFPVCIHVNEVNLGSTKNFERAIALCQGDWIALCDQDDKWSPDKLARMESAIAPGVGLVISDAWLSGPNLERTGLRAWANLPFTPRMQRRFDQGEGPRLMLSYNLVTGATCAFRADLREVILPVSTAWVHDGWIGFLAAALAEARTISEPLVEYRQHAHQQIGIPKLSFVRQLKTAYYRLDRAYYERMRIAFEEMAERLASCADRLRDPALVELARRKAAQATLRRDMRDAARWKRVFFAARELFAGRYHLFGHGLRDFAVDVLLR